MEHMEHLTEQLEMPLFQLINKAVFLDESLIQKCRNEADAILICWANRRIKGMTLTEGARLLRMPKSHLSNILSGNKYLPFDGRVKLQLLCGNWAIRQYEDSIIGANTSFLSPAEIEINRLKNEVEQLKKRGLK